jgi:hypothetical protein
MTATIITLIVLYTIAVMCLGILRGLKMRKEFKKTGKKQEVKIHWWDLIP